jgi:hypothetical protein
MTRPQSPDLAAEVEMRELLAATDDYIEMETVGSGYLSYEAPTADARAEYVAFRAAVSSLLAELARMRPVYTAALAWARYGRDDADDEHELICAVRRACKAASEAGK